MKFFVFVKLQSVKQSEDERTISGVVTGDGEVPLEGGNEGRKADDKTDVSIMSLIVNNIDILVLIVVSFYFRTKTNKTPDRQELALHTIAGPWKSWW